MFRAYWSTYFKNIVYLVNCRISIPEYNSICLTLHHHYYVAWNVVIYQDSLIKNRYERIFQNLISSLIVWVGGAILLKKVSHIILLKYVLNYIHIFGFLSFGTQYFLLTNKDIILINVFVFCISIFAASS